MASSYALAAPSIAFASLAPAMGSPRVGYYNRLSSNVVAAASKQRPGNFAGGKGVVVRAHDGRGVQQLPPSPSSHGEGSGAGGAAAAGQATSGGGIGIEAFLGGKNFLITGGTGFLGKVLIEKILRTNRDVGKIYVLIKAKDTESASKRLQTEVVDAELFKCLQEIHGKDYHSFMARKLLPVASDVGEADIGIAPELADEIAQEVDVIVNSAANTTFDERYDVAMNINTLGPFRMMSFAQRFQRLKLFLHVSTAYVNGQRQGVALEKPFRMGDTIAKELGSSDYPPVDIEAEIRAAFHSTRQPHDDSSAYFSQEMKHLGLERASLHGWQNVYVFTKAMGEMVVNCMRGEIPVVAIRPSVIESTLNDPFPGWIQGIRMLDPVIAYYGKGQLTGFVADPNTVLDVVPADMVVSAMLASMARHGGAAAGMHVYHVASSTANPVLVGDLFRFFFRHFARSPLADAAGRAIPVRPMRLFGGMERFASYVEGEGSSAAGARAAAPLSPRGLRATKAAEQAVVRLARLYEPYFFYGGRFGSANTESLLAEMSPAERARFTMDVRSVDWEDYITNVHIPGLKKHAMKGRGVAASSARGLA